MSKPEKLAQIISKLDKVKNLTDAQVVPKVCNEVLAELPLLITDEEILKDIQKKLNPQPLMDNWETYQKSKHNYDMADVKESGDALLFNIKEVITMLKKL